MLTQGSVSTGHIQPVLSIYWSLSGYKGTHSHTGGRKLIWEKRELAFALIFLWSRHGLSVSESGVQFCGQLRGLTKKRQINCRSHHPAFVNLQRKQVSAFSCNQRGHKKMLMISISGHGCWFGLCQNTWWPLDLVMKAIKDQSPEKKT